mmetsp:Transcript_38609/g.46722  ORF Transcript_38609/g.46722 Transcript_38609/m.46722 type:complete len:524 (+) Transcript_38609:89-1660(+)|eukprot:CAMPEP_0197846642 /NCGR_PEP_ID=MMETSP1438-20131217/3937_1 /TAXON_ID=1461541 /ORGANISM="Pterosperma sp., Strain CCMP1384" /LENGTH=523 /DNA_ID=CAMNT_0043458361 /DNA_START=87 /DNA_END=1658 /DNA_ORIENTATION=+
MATSTARTSGIATASFNVRSSKKASVIAPQHAFVSGQRAGSVKACFRNRRASKLERQAVVTTATATQDSSKAKTVSNITVRDPDAPLSKSVLSVILGGGAGTRLYPLTKQRAKPAVPIGGAYRLIDVPMSNCLNSGISKIYILTQFNSVSLNRHLARAYNFGNGIRFGGEGFVEVLAATQTPTDKEWFQGTADAVRQYTWLLEDIKNKGVEDIIILSGDHLYRMDYSEFIQTHRDTNADITVSCLPMDDSRAADFGLMKIDDTGRIIDFAEKPQGEALKAMKVDTTILGLDKEAASVSPYIASMGIYVFKKSALVQLLKEDFPSCNDFGSEILPGAKDNMHLQAHLFSEYWEDIGTIKSFFDANLALAKQPPRFEFFDANSPIYTSPRFLPPAKIEKSSVKDSIISHGASLEECTVNEAIIGLRSRIGKGAQIDKAMVMGADYYESAADREKLIEAGKIPVGIGENCVISNTIVDKNARIGPNCVITNKDGIEEARHEDQGYYIRSGIVTIFRNATIPAGTVI